jgi:hypothetical protein
MRIMNPVDLRGVDLNLLVSLRVLLTRRHVTRAAGKLGLTQPAMSGSLARSRILFGDKLLLCGPEGLVLTPRGEEILELLHKIMEVTERLVALPEEFRPETSHRTFTLLGSDFVEFILLNGRVSHRGLELAGCGQAAGSQECCGTYGQRGGRHWPWIPARFPEELIRRTLFREPFFVGMARRGHPLLCDENLSLERYVHVQVLPRDATMYGDAIDATISAALGRNEQRRALGPSLSGRSGRPHSAGSRKLGSQSTTLRTNPTAHRGARTAHVAHFTRLRHVFAPANPGGHWAQVAQGRRSRCC